MPVDDRFRAGPRAPNCVSPPRAVQIAAPAPEAPRPDAVRELRVAVSRLRGVHSVADLLTRAAAELTRCTGADVAALLRVEGDEAVVQSLCSVDHGDITGQAFERPPFLLRPFAVESAVVRRQRPAVTGAEALAVGSAGRLPWPPREITCAVAPIVAGGRVIGMAHAGWAAPRRPPGDEELATVWAFAEAFGAIIENVWLLERLQLQLEHVRPLLMAVGAVLGEVSASAISLAPASAETVPSMIPGLTLGDRVGTVADLGVTQRELEVLALMARGATNARIATELTISEATVKSHVRTILRKLHASNRAEAVSHYSARQAR
jgi:DNA-binding CsgD family transcriptional regulator